MAERHYCKIHDTVFFKKGRMKGYAHPIEGSEEATGATEWCNEDAEKVAELPSQSKDEMLPQHQAEIDKARSVDHPPPAPQAVGMMTKEIGDMMRAGLLTTIFGKKIRNELTKWYRAQTLGITRVPFEGKDLPELKKD